jgi:hypothetical protein
LKESRNVQRLNLLSMVRKSSRNVENSETNLNLNQNLESKFSSRAGSAYNSNALGYNKHLGQPSESQIQPNSRPTYSSNANSNQPNIPKYSRRTPQ